MYKLKIFAMGNDDSFNYFIVEKHKKFHTYFREIINALFQHPPDISFGDIENVDSEINKIFDAHYSINIGRVRIDIFHGKNKTFITFICSKKMREKIFDEFFRFFEIKKQRT